MEISRKWFGLEQIIGKLWEREVALCYGRIPDLRITAEAVEKANPFEYFLPDFCLHRFTQNHL